MKDVNPQSGSMAVIVPEQAGAVMPAPNTQDPISILATAIEKHASPEALAAAMNVRRELRDEHAKTEFEAALSAFQSECPMVIKTVGVNTNAGKEAYKYAPLEQIEQIIRPYEAKHGLNHTFDTDITADQGWVISKCILTHRAGHSRTSQVKLPLGTRTQIMSDTQVYAAALTFANRRALCNAYGLVIAGEDKDGQGARSKPMGPSTLRGDPAVDAMRKEAWALLLPVRGTAKPPNWDIANQWLWREDLLDGAIPEVCPNLKPERFHQLIEKLRTHPGLKT